MNDEYLKRLMLEVERQECLNSFYEFFLSFWSTIVKEPLLNNWHIKYLCDELQYVAEFIQQRKDKPYDLIINVPPGSTKTTIVLQMYPAWLWAIDPTIRIISSSHGSTLSIDSAMKSRDIITSARYKNLFPHVRLRMDKSAKTSYENTKNGTRDVTSTGSSITGRHAHVKLLDDLQDISKSASEPDRNAAINHMKTLFTREVEKGKSVNILIMQRLHELDCTAYLLSINQKRKVKHICLPAEISDRVSPKELRQHYVDGLLDPIRMSRTILEQKRLELGSYGYTSQFGQDPTPPEGGIIKRIWFKTLPKEQSMTHNVAINFFIDTAYEEKKANKTKGESINDPTGLMACYERNGICYILDYREVYLGITELTKFIYQWALNHGYHANKSIVYIEPKASGKSTVQTLREFTKLNVKEITGAKDSKETELTNSAPVIESGRFVLVEGEWNHLFIDRVCGFPNAAHDEAVDLLCYARKHYFSGLNPAVIDEAFKKALAFFS